MSDQQPHILFLCTGNSARSIFAEFLMRRQCAGRFKVSSAGASPKPAVHPMTLRVLKELYHIDTTGARPKSWEEFRDQKIDFLITLCDNALENCPVWPGKPVAAHWGSPDPAAVQGDERTVLDAFRKSALLIHRRIELFCSLPIEKLDQLRLQEMVSAIANDSQAALPTGVNA